MMAARQNNMSQNNQKQQDEQQHKLITLPFVWGASPAKKEINTIQYVCSVSNGIIR